MLSKVEYFCHPNRFPVLPDILCSKQLIIEERFDIPCDKPDIESLVHSKINPVIEHYKYLDSVIGKKVLIKGRLDQEILYIADAFCQPVHAFKNSYPFSTYLDLCECTMSTHQLEEYSPRILVEYAETQQICPRSISKSIILFVWYPRFFHPMPIPQPVYIVNQRTEYHERCRPQVRKSRHTRILCEE
ncbi:MAG: DUF3794 domain-containing protein [Syntrophomonas sp.]